MPHPTSSTLPYLLTPARYLHTGSPPAGAIGCANLFYTVLLSLVFLSISSCLTHIPLHVAFLLYPCYYLDIHIQNDQKVDSYIYL